MTLPPLTTRDNTKDLHLAALDGNYERVRDALASGVDVNAVDGLGRNALMCAIAGHDWDNLQVSAQEHITNERLSIIHLLLEHPDTTMATLNGPQDAFNGVTPLGMASWLNMPHVVSLMLEISYGTVSVDVMDAHGATALMYAARDGNLAVVKELFRHGARPEFRSQNHRSSVQYALPHPEILYLCEAVLRNHRLRESKSSNTRKLSPHRDLQDYSVTAFTSIDTLTIPVFAPETTSRLTDTLVKIVTSADIPFLRSLLFSSPDDLAIPVLVNQQDSRGWSPMHYCVSTVEPSMSILDMLYCAGADVALFTDKEHYTPLHCLAKYAPAARGPESALLLYQFITHLIQDLRAPLAARDKHDETCIHIAAEHGSCVEVLIALLDSDIKGSVREMKNARGLTALDVCKPEFRYAFGLGAESTRSTSSLSVSTVRASDSFASLASLTNWNVKRKQDFNVPRAIQQFVALLRSTNPQIFLAKEDPENKIHEASRLSQELFSALRTRNQELLKELAEVRTKRESTVSMLDTVRYVAHEQVKKQNLKTIRPPLSKLYTSVSTQTDYPTLSRRRSGPLAQLFDGLRSKPDLVKKDKKRSFWIKQKLSTPVKYSVVSDIDEKHTEVGREVQTLPPTPRIDKTQSSNAIEYTLRTSTHVFSTITRDLDIIVEHIANTERRFSELDTCITKLERITERTLKTRLSSFAKLSADPDQSPKTQKVNHRVSSGSLFTLSSTSVVSMPETPSGEHDDEDTKIIRRLLLRKIEARTKQCLIDMDRMHAWLRVLKETINGVRRRAYL